MMMYQLGNDDFMNNDDMNNYQLADVNLIYGKYNNRLDNESDRYRLDNESDRF